MIDLKNFIIMTANFQSLFYRRSIVYFDDVKLYSPIDKPDIFIKDIDFSPKNPSDMEKVNISVKIGNSGGKSAKNFSLKCYLDGYYFNSLYVDELKEGNEKILNFTWNAIYGMHNFSFVVDEENNVDEITESNNIQNISMKVGPLLVVSVSPIFLIKEEERKNIDITLYCYGCAIRNVTLFYSCENISGKIEKRHFPILYPGEPERVSIDIKAPKLNGIERMNGKILLWAIADNAESEKREVDVIVYASFPIEKVAVSILSLSGLFAFLYIIFNESGKYKFLSFIIPLFARYSKDEVLDNFVRGQIYGFIKSNPGCHYSYIKKKLEIQNGILAYHLKILEKSGLIKSERKGRYRIFTITGINFPESKRYTLSQLQISIIDLIRNNKGITQKEIASRLKEKQQKISYNLKILEMANKIVSIKKGRKKHYYLYEDFYEE